MVSAASPGLVALKGRACAGRPGAAALSRLQGHTAVGPGGLRSGSRPWPAIGAEAGASPEAVTQGQRASLAPRRGSDAPSLCGSTALGQPHARTAGSGGSGGPEKLPITEMEAEAEDVTEHQGHVSGSRWRGAWWPSVRTRSHWNAGSRYPGGGVQAGARASLGPVSTVVPMEPRVPSAGSGDKPTGTRCVRCPRVAGVGGRQGNVRGVEVGTRRGETC